ncbi:hypothetical protein MPL3356_590002 [Mesorhizobium plurifarium]|uniref:Uncharacterized protein n=1 Tax=Mesorhizobium plurifarium TaxID=69974 RepID=A0A090ECG4_MESPL|nr:hypothetical protein MPL3356_590002 [Mesorhizobium plurifarium]CDX61341.1 hypothetical protein MPL1032_370040 [Mesorhizobium plurifarium]
MSNESLILRDNIYPVMVSKS